MARDAEPVVETAMDPDPFVQFGRWYTEATEAVRHPQSMVVATAGADCRPSARMVLLKDWGPEGFVFYTNLSSRKGRELAVNPVAMLLWYWEPLGRQVRVDGDVTPVGAAESDRYFATRPRAAQVGAHASDQSTPIDDRGALERRVAEVGEQFDGREVPRPADWGGIRVTAREFEFWQNREDRLHDRIRYRPGGDGWTMDRLQP